MARVEFEIVDELHREAQDIAAEMGLTIGDLARSAFESYLDGARAARRGDLDEPGRDSATLRHLPAADSELLRWTLTAQRTGSVHKIERRRDDAHGKCQSGSCSQSIERSVLNSFTHEGAY